jgi:2-polyprenyl-3-methyl-5-hydroxy-6-metoxy-1,4-benzoquinol methylase
MNLFPSEYDYDAGIAYPKNSANLVNFDYSDGETFELQIQEVIANAKDRSLFSDEIRTAGWDWRSSCHLSPVRANLLRPLAPLLHGRVLELGAGCGILTRYLGELGGNVVALEASRLRAEITRLRTQDLGNVSVVCDRIEDFEAREKFDVVTLIGVLQYARLFSDQGEGAELTLLRNAAKQLKDDGVLVVAIQNRLSLKSLAGYPEPNVGVPYFGVEGHYGDNTIARFGLEELKVLLSDAGLSHHRIFFPFPDYHMPTTIFSERGAKSNGRFRAQALMAATAGRDKARLDWSPLQFSLESAWNSVHVAGATTYLANAFLVLATADESSLRFQGDDQYAWHYSVDRVPGFAIEKKFGGTGDEVSISATPVTSINPPNGPISHHFTKEEYVPGKMVWEELVDTVNRPGWSLDDLAQPAGTWIDYLMSANPGVRTLDMMVSGALFDCTPFNCITKDGNLTFIDREWEARGTLSVAYIVIRGLFGSFSAITSCALPSPGTPLRICEMIVGILKRTGFDVTSDHIEGFIVKEASMQSLIYNGAETEPSAPWRAYVTSASLEARTPHSVLVQSLAEKDRRIESLENANRMIAAEFESTLSWRITTPLRQLVSLARRVKRKLT